jgi:PAS domain S-box-containing protein
LRESELLLREVFDNANDAIFLLERTPEGPGTYILVNEKAVRMLGYSKEELLKMSPRDIVPAEVAASVMPEVIKRLLRDGHATFESVHRRKDGSRYPIEVSTHTFRYQGKDVDLSIIRDITERRKAQETLLQTNRKLSLLSGITRHDLRNQVFALNAYLGISRNHLGDAVKMAEFIDQEEKVTRIIEHQIAFAKDYENIGVKAPAWQDCHTLVSVASAQFLPGQIVVQNDLPEGAEIFADPLVVKVFFNLMDNAVRYGGKITMIRFSAEERGRSRILVCEDDGEGIPLEDKGQIFERGFGRNTGLGLYLAREVLAMTGITIRETGEPGKGARFEIQVPGEGYRVRAP